MFVVGDILISDAVLEASFACNLGRCLGGCCVQGEAGAPLQEDEVPILETVFSKVRKYLRPEALAVIETHGVWETTAEDAYATTCVNGGACVFVTYEGPVAKCAIQKAYHKGEVDWPKPISCHLYPLRIHRYGDQDVINYEQIDLCAPARRHGQNRGIALFDFLREPLIRKYGTAWYETFRTTCIERAQILFNRPS